MSTLYLPQHQAVRSTYNPTASPITPAPSPVVYPPSTYTQTFHTNIHTHRASASPSDGVPPPPSTAESRNASSPVDDKAATVFSDHHPTETARGTAAPLPLAPLSTFPDRDVAVSPDGDREDDDLGGVGDPESFRQDRPSAERVLIES